MYKLKRVFTTEEHFAEQFINDEVQLYHLS